MTMVMNTMQPLTWIKSGPILVAKPFGAETLPVQSAVPHSILHLLIRVLAGQVRSVLAAGAVVAGPCDWAGLASHLAFSFSGRDHSIFPSAFLEHFVVSFKLSSSGHVRVHVAPSGPSGTFQVAVCVSIVMLPTTVVSLPVAILLPKPSEH